MFLSVDNFEFESVLNHNGTKYLTKVIRIDPFTKMKKFMVMDVMPKDIIDWLESDEVIQKALYQLSTDEREFLLSGLTPLESELLFVEDKSMWYRCEECDKHYHDKNDAEWCCKTTTRDFVCPICGDKHAMPSLAEDCCKDLFIEIPVLRGFTEIKDIFNTISKLGGMIIGGYARYMCSPLKTPVKAEDLDIYCSDMETFDRIKKEFRSNTNVKLQFESNNAISYTTINKWQHCPIIQLVKPINEGKKIVSGSVEEILMNFDFTITRAYLKNENTCIVDKRFLFDEENMFLRIKNIHCPISSTFRFMKYRHKGYSTGAREILKLFHDWDKRDDGYKNKLVEYFDIKNPSQTEIDQLEALLNID